MKVHKLVIRASSHILAIVTVLCLASCIEQSPPSDATPRYTQLYKAARSGNADAMRDFGFYLRDLAPDNLRDGQEAISWFKRSASKGNAEGAFQVAYTNHEGLGVPVDTKTAIAWYNRALELDTTASMRGAHQNLAQIYRKGEGGVPKNYKRARHHYGQAIEFDLERALTPLGEMYEKGQGGPRDVNKAIELYRQAAPYSSHARDHLKRLGVSQN